MCLSKHQTDSLFDAGNDLLINSISEYNDTARTVKSKQRYVAEIESPQGIRDGNKWCCLLSDELNDENEGWYRNNVD